MCRKQKQKHALAFFPPEAFLEVTSIFKNHIFMIGEIIYFEQNPEQGIRCP